eukprot:TRINITY_DN18536_c0_g1_i1.p1 TRINITY_DN18536_c0_g1~~TRINITY_DN18536_c0_g1_i1.p1  ORF type:complete len:166 (-),score=10.31 TRINITY_DN18536_c0_g1_i1:236-733(-)
MATGSSFQMPGTPRTRTAAEAGVNYLRGSKVGSATGYICVGGSILGIPHGKKRPKSMSSTGTKFASNSEASSQFKEMPYCYASMDRKPLTPYEPNSHRSRLALDDAPVPYKNSSAIEFNAGIHCCHKKRFLTSSQLAYTGEPCDPRSNQGMISESVKWQREQRSK